MDYALKITVIPSNKSITKINPKGEKFKSKMIKDASVNSIIIIPEVIVKKLTYNEKNLGLKFLRNTENVQKLEEKYPNDDAAKRFKKLIFEFNKKNEKKPPEYKSREIREFFKEMSIIDPSKITFKLFENQKLQIKNAIQAKLKKIFKPKSKIGKTYLWNPSKSVLLCDYTWKLEDPPKNMVEKCKDTVYKGFYWKTCKPKKIHDMKKELEIKLKKIQEIINTDKIDKKKNEQKGIGYFDDLAKEDDYIKMLNQFYHKGKFKNKKQEEMRHNLVELIIAYIKNKFKIIKLMEYAEEQQKISEDAKKFFDSMNKNEKNGKFKKANKHIFADLLSCYDSNFLKKYQIYEYRIKEIKKNIKKNIGNYAYNWRLDEDLHNEHLKFSANLRDAKILITNQVRWRQILVHELRKRFKLLEKLIQIDIYRGLFQTNVISYKKYHENLELIDPYFKEIIGQYNKKEMKKEINKGEILTRQDLNQLIQKEIKKMDKIYDKKHQLTHNQQIEIAKLPKLNKNWKKECPHLFSKYKWQDEIIREDLVHEDWENTAVRADIIKSFSKLYNTQPLNRSKKTDEQLIMLFLNEQGNLDNLAKASNHTKEQYIQAFKPFIDDAKKITIWDKKRSSHSFKGGGPKKDKTQEIIQRTSIDKFIEHLIKKKTYTKDLFKGNIDLLPEQKKQTTQIPLHITVKLNLYRKDCSTLNKLKENCAQNRKEFFKALHIPQLSCEKGTDSFSWWPEEKEKNDNHQQGDRKKGLGLSAVLTTE